MLKIENGGLGKRVAKYEALTGSAVKGLKEGYPHFLHYSYIILCVCCS